MSMSVLAPPPTDRVPIAIQAAASRRTRLGYFGGSARARGHVRVGLRALARTLLSERAPGLALARVVRGTIRHRRAEQLVLPPAVPRAVRTLAPRGPAGFPVRREAQSLHHAHQAAERGRRDRRAVVRYRRRPWAFPRHDPRAAPAPFPI